MTTQQALLPMILRHAMASRATTIHLEPGPAGMIVRERIDGLLAPAGAPLPPRVEADLVASIRRQAAAGATDGAPWTGRFFAELAGGTVDVIASACPTALGPSLTLFVIDPRTAVPPLDKLGFPHDLVKAVRKAASRPGLFVVNGPVNSGKTTTLYSLLKEQVRPDLKVMSAENPVEVRLEGVQQIELKLPALDFVAAIKAMLHADVDVAMVAEVRDPESLRLMLGMATSRRVLTVLHAPDTLAALRRILDLYGAGESRSLVADVVAGILDQRLVRRACPECAQHEPIRDEDARALGLGHRAKGVVARGCAACRKTGFKGSVVAGGLLTITPALRRAMESGAGLDDLAKAAGDDALGLRRSLAKLVLDGVVSAAEARRILDPKASAG
jgi:type II secretory ATPase GspE/PulE/Tfp pilus assembly ATPase PilB-like protein